MQWKIDNGGGREWVKVTAILAKTNMTDEWEKLTLVNVVFLIIVCATYNLIT